MKNLPNLLLRWCAHRGVLPAVLGKFLLIYIVIAFFNDETLITLIALIQSNPFPVVLLALIPINSVARVVAEFMRFRKLRKAMAGEWPSGTAALFDDEIEVGRAGPWAELQIRLAAAGYTTHHRDGTFAAWRGVTLFPARILFLTATFCLFAGILISITTRVSRREALIEGELLPRSAGVPGVVERIKLIDDRGLFLARSLTISVTDGTGEKRSFGLYPPGFLNGLFVYPRYLGIAPLIRFSAPDLPGGFESYLILMIYPPGKEDGVDITGTPYRITFSMAPFEPGNDDYITGRVRLLFKLNKGNDELSTGIVPLGGEISGTGFRLAFPDMKRLVATDFIRDYGVPLRWGALILFCIWFLIWLAIKAFSPRREMLFRHDPRGVVVGFSRAEGKRRAHAGAFNDALDLLGKEHPMKS